MRHVVHVSEILAALRQHQERGGGYPARVVVPYRSNVENDLPTGCNLPSVSPLVIDLEAPVVCGARMNSFEAGKRYFDGTPPAELLEREVYMQAMEALTGGLHLPVRVYSDTERDELVATTTFVAARYEENGEAVLVIRFPKS